MGIVDYVCFVLQNGQYHPCVFDSQDDPDYEDISRKEFKKLANCDPEDIGLEFSYPEGAAYLVSVPRKYTLEFISKQKFSWFAQFEAIIEEYEPDEYGFPGVPGHYEYMCRSTNSVDPGDNQGGIWTPYDEDGEDEGDFWNVNFNPVCYKLFVTKTLKPKDVKWIAWATMLEHSGLDVPPEVYKLPPKKLYYYLKYRGKCQKKWKISGSR